MNAEKNDAPAAPRNALTRWAEADRREASIRRDLWATAKLCEILGLCSFDDAQRFLPDFNDLSEMGYAGYCYYDFASVSMRGIFDAYRTLLREHTGNPGLDPIHVWMWTGKFLNARDVGSTGATRMIFKNIAEPESTAVFFGRFLRCDRKYGVESGRTTKVDLIKAFSDDFDTTHAGFMGIGVPDKDIAILRTMDLINTAYPQS
jgi:hypothetical protein